MTRLILYQREKLSLLMSNIMLLMSLSLITQNLYPAMRTFWLHIQLRVVSWTLTDEYYNWVEWMISLQSFIAVLHCLCSMSWWLSSNAHSACCVWIVTGKNVGSNPGSHQIVCVRIMNANALRLISRTGKWCAYCLWLLIAFKCHQGQTSVKI